MRLPLPERFWSKVDKNGPLPSARPELGPCWVWTGATSDGYGHFWLNGRVEPSHRVAWELTKGPIPEGLELDHLCRNTACVNPNHLEPVTCGENIRRGLTGRASGAKNRAKTACPRGHAYTPENTRLQKGWRVCVQCARLASRSQYAKRKTANGKQKGTQPC